jgi:hypothetical protein
MDAEAPPNGNVVEQTAANALLWEVVLLLHLECLLLSFTASALGSLMTTWHFCSFSRAFSTW